MESKKLDILADKRKQNGQVLTMLAIYCRKHRMLDINLRNIAPDVLDRVGNEIVDLFVERIQEHKRKTPPDQEAHRNTGVPRTRGQTRS
ncbi:hypothetical protein [Celeribacter ethanolicus]|uniref:hypothetical protein n=1 Tax=Celeribacter ethanolicus TaxID=1758178 RepID=UPI0008340C54|nr:hypothetical protein [Celeribacter ethanolicus]